jgi:glycosyltransferase involved in cell wall biosynthesis
MNDEKIIPRVAVLIPCFNEEKTVAQVVADFRASLPGSEIYVFDNCSTDRTAELAKQAGARVVFSPRPGKGYVIRHMFNTVEADVYLMADGDSTYPASEAPKLVDCLLRHHADMVVGTRMATYAQNAFRRFHVFGNKMVAKLISLLFGVKVTDVLSGYRAFSREFVKLVPLVSSGFEIETEMTLQASAKNFRILEVPVSYGERPEGSVSKLNTFSDGFLVLKALLFIFKDYRPLVFFTAASFFFFLLSVLVGSAPIVDYLRFHYVYRVPLAILAAAIAIVAILTFFVGIILETVRKYHGENFELWRKKYQQDLNEIKRP